MNLVSRAFENHFDIRSCENRGIVLDKNPKRENASPKGERRKKTSGKERLPVHVPPEKTGLTPEEEAYVPRTESRPLSRFFFVSIPLLLVNELGFDYLRDNMVIDQAHMVQRKLNYAIINDAVDRKSVV